MGLLEDRVAIVTGAGRGVGQATAALLAAHGARVALNDLDADVCEAATQAILDEGGAAIAIPGSVTDAELPERLVADTLAAFGTIDIIVNNAGYIWNGAAHKHSDEQFQAMLDVHVAAPFRILRAFSAWLRPQAKAEIAADGRARCRKIVNVSSVSGTRGAATQVGYSAGKAAVVGMTKALAREWGRYNVTVNAVAFGYLATRLTQGFEGEPPTIEVGGRAHRVGIAEDATAELARATPLGRLGTPEDGAGGIFLLCLPQSDYVTGEVLEVSGGA
ncbi:MAG: SDR family oxidoreductase [Pseudomonadales bacterium]|jgi:3-oxoacyl-[acyl-carrier protein] reductase|nr:SDR family oxidoreductase [Pseudomonadales bacterium]